jgi:hypothetical protein
MVDQKRDYAGIGAASHVAREGALAGDVVKLGKGINASYAVQLKEGMIPLPEAAGCVGRKYCGGGFGGYALYLFGSPNDRSSFLASNPEARAIEPFSSWE